MPAETTSQNHQKGTPFPAWRLPNGIKNASEDDIERASSSCETWVIRSGLLVLFGLIIEVAAAIVRPSNDSALGIWTPVIADMLVALGVGGEVMFSMMESRRQKELTRRSNDKLTEAVDRAAQAQLETERLKSEFAWRGLLNFQVSAIRDHLGTATRESIIIFHLMNDPESQNLAQAIAEGFRLAHWGVQLNACQYAGPFVFEIRLPTLRGPAQPVSRIAQQALHMAGIDFVDGEIPPSIMETAYGGMVSPPWALLYVGPKPRPSAVVTI